MRLGVFLLLSVTGLAVAGCGNYGLTRKAAPSEALPFKASLKDEKDGTLIVTVRAGGAGLAEVRESARYQVTQYCLFKRGSSDADWVMNPTSGDWATSVDERGDLTVRARCRA